MSITNSFALLEDLARLVRKYGPEVFSDLSALLRDPRKMEDLTTILEAGASAGRRATMHRTGSHPQRRQSPPVNLAHLISQIGTTDPERADLILKFYEDLSAKRILPTLREIRGFAQENRLKGTSAESREKAIGPLIRDLSGRTRDQIVAAIGLVRPDRSVEDDRSLARWADVILDRSRSGR